MNSASRRVCCVVLVFSFPLSHGSRSSQKCAEWNLFLTFLLPKLRAASKEYRSKGSFVLLWGWGANNKDPLREGDGARILQMWGYSVSASPLGAAASLLQRPKYGTHLWVPKKKYPGDYESLSAPFTEPLGLPKNSVCSPGLCETLIWIKLLPSLSTQLVAVLSLSCNFSFSFHRETVDSFNSVYREVLISKPFQFL